MNLVQAQERADEERGVGGDSDVKRRRLFRGGRDLRRAYVEEQLVRQGGGCGLCGSKSPRNANGWHLDHCQSTDPRKVIEADCRSYRAVLCHHCNALAVAAYETDPDAYAPLMPGVAAYVDGWDAIIGARFAGATGSFADA